MSVEVGVLVVQEVGRGVGGGGGWMGWVEEVGGWRRWAEG